MPTYATVKGKPGIPEDPILTVVTNLTFEDVLSDSTVANITITYDDGHTVTYEKGGD